MRIISNWSEFSIFGPKAFTIIGLMLRKVSDKFKDIQKIGSNKKRKIATENPKLKNFVDPKVEDEVVYPSLSSILTPEAVTGSEVNGQ